MAAVFHYRCVEPAHQGAAEPSIARNPITVHESRWAYCACGAADGHAWEAITPASLEDLRIQAPTEASHAST